MKLSTKGRYGLRALIDIAENSCDEPVSISAISERQGVSTSYLEQLTAKLKKAGFVDSVRGVRGGYTLAMLPEEITVGNVLRALEGDLSPVECPGLKKEEGCANADGCVSKRVWQKINDSVNNAVDSLTLAELIEDGESAKSKKTNCAV